jgi:uncharacterized LabA/DUF88 family protein
VGRLAIFLDGAYIDYLLRDQFDNVRIDYNLLSQAITRRIAEQTIGGIDLLRTYYYHCLPYQSNPPTQAESERYGRMRSFVASLERIPRFQVRLGRLAYRGNRADGSPILEQKRVDMMLGVDLALLTAKQQITHAALVAGDSDFLPAIEAAKPQGVLLWLFHGPEPHTELWEAADERTLIDPGFVEQIRRG